MAQSGQPRAATRAASAASHHWGMSFSRKGILVLKQQSICKRGNGAARKSVVATTLLLMMAATDVVLFVIRVFL
jgi:hypothetical protein